jgi:hypothetical protein
MREPFDLSGPTQESGQGDKHQLLRKLFETLQLPVYISKLGLGVDLHSGIRWAVAASGERERYEEVWTEDLDRPAT